MKKHVKPNEIIEYKKQIVELSGYEEQMQKKLETLEPKRYIVTAKKKNYQNICYVIDTQKNVRAVVKEVTLEIKGKNYKTIKEIREIKALDRVYMNPDSVKEKYGLEHFVELITYYIDGQNDCNPNLPATLYQITVEEDCTLEEYVKQKKPSLEQKIEQFIQLCKGLEQLHEKTVHRDIKPTNILMDGDKAKFNDMGTACGKQGETTKSVGGTLEYMAPDLTMSTKSDIFSLGATLYEIVNNVKASEKIYDTKFARDKDQECNNEIDEIPKMSQTRINIMDNNEEKELSEYDRKVKDIIINTRKKVIKDYLNNMKEQCGNEYIKEIIKKAMNPEAEINLIYPETNVRYQSAREMKTDLVIAQRADKLKHVSDRFDKLENAVKDAAGKVRKRITDYDTSKIEEAYKAKWQFCNELLNEVGPKYGITQADLAKSHLLRVYTDNKVMLIFEKSLEYIFGKNPGLDIPRFAQASPSAKTKEEVDAEKRAYYTKHGAAKIDQLTDDEKMSFANWKAKLLDLKRKCDLGIQV